MSDLQSSVRSALEPSYRVERELDGGGMARVFLATDTALSRRVVVRLLPPDAAAAVSGERFQRDDKFREAAALIRERSSAQGRNTARQHARLTWALALSCDSAPARQEIGAKPRRARITWTGSGRPSRTPR